MSLFPTGKPHISFSEIFCWKECPYRHKLTHVDKLGTFEASPYLGFGTGVHESCEKYIETRAMDSKYAIKEIDKYWDENQEAITRYVDANAFCKYSPEREQWKQIAEDILVDWGRRGKDSCRWLSDGGGLQRCCWHWLDDNRAGHHGLRVRLFHHWRDTRRY